MRRALEVADIFRRHGAAYREAHAGHLSRGQRRVMGAIETCRSAALGGHVEQCNDCGQLRIAYNSCLMGKFRNGELAGGRVADPAGTSNDCGRLFSRFAPHNVAVPEIDVSSDDCDPAARGRRQGDTMLETYFAAPKALERLRAGPSGPYMDGFAASLKRDGYGAATAVRYLRAAAHLGHFLQSRGGTLAEIDLSAFFRHLRTCRCPRWEGGRRNHHTSFGAKRYRDYLVQIGVCRCSVAPEIQSADPALVDFRRWLQKHRGAAEPTVRQYSRGAAELLRALGDDPTCWNAKGVRAHFLERTARCGVGTAEKLVTSLRAFLRYLSVHGRCRADLDKAVPGFASWRLADLPRYLTAEQVDRLIAACDGGSPARRRDRAIIMLLARLGLRAGDVARLRIADIEWETGTLRVSGKGRYQVRLALPQDVGDAIIDYVECRPRVCDSDHLFVRNIAPFRSFAHGDGVSSVVKRAMKRAGVVTPAKGAHVLRHTAATEMLRHGVPLDQIALVLRHRGVDTTAYYAKADVNSLKQIAQPWPEALP